MVKRVLKIQINNQKALNEFLKKMNETKEFYNACLFLTRFRYFEYSKNNKNASKDVIEGFNSYNLNDWLMNPNVYLGNMATYGNNFLVKISEKLRTSLTRKEQQTILKKVCSDWNSFFGSLKESKESKRKVNIPYYKQGNYAVSEFNKQMILFSRWNKEHSLGITGTSSYIKMPDWLSREQVQATRLKYRNGKVYLEVIYNKNEVKRKTRLLKNRIASIDPGLNHITTITFNWMKKPISISGKHLKSVNQLYNKNIAQLNSIISKTQNEDEINKLKSLKNNVTEKRNKRIEHELHVISNYIIEILLEHKVSTLVFGHNKGQKTCITIGKVNNQNFVSIPFNKLIQLLEYKCSENNIKFVLQEESYTSKASFLSNNFIPTYNKEESNDYKFSGYRVKRGIYKDNTHNITIHSDCNGSYNILQKSGLSNSSLNKIRRAIINKKSTIETFGLTVLL